VAASARTPREEQDDPERLTNFNVLGAFIRRSTAVPHALTGNSYGPYRLLYNPLIYELFLNRNHTSRGAQRKYDPVLMALLFVIALRHDNRTIRLAFVLPKQPCATWTMVGSG
jgi:hypothetical protein